VSAPNALNYHGVARRARAHLVMPMRKDSFQITRSRVTLSKPGDGPGPFGLCLDSLKVEGVFQAPDERLAPSADGADAITPAVEGAPPLVEVNITSHRLVILKRRS
jgi:hypothetical protein